MLGLRIVENALSSMKFLLFVAILSFVDLIKNGIWCSTNIDLQWKLAINPFSDPYRSHQKFLLENWLGPCMAWLLGLTSIWSFIILHFVFSVVFLVTNVIAMGRSLGERERRKAFCLFMCLPVAWTPLYAIGYDALTLALMSLILALLGRPWLTLPLGVGLGLQHFEQGVIGFAALLFVLIDDHLSIPQWPQKAVSVAAVLAGILLGHLIWVLVMRAHGIMVSTGRLDFLLAQAEPILRANLYTLDLFFCSLLGAGWLIVIHYGQYGTHRGAVGAVLFLCGCITFLTFDVTRVFAVITYPVMGFCLMFDERWLSGLSSRSIAAIMAAWITFPWLFDFGGHAHMAVFPYDLAVISSSVWGWPDLPANFVQWPFN